MLQALLKNDIVRPLGFVKTSGFIAAAEECRRRAGTEEVMKESQLIELTKQELIKLAQQLGLKGLARLKKIDLIGRIIQCWLGGEESETAAPASPETSAQPASTLAATTGAVQPEEASAAPRAPDGSRSRTHHQPATTGDYMDHESYSSFLHAPSSGEPYPYADTPARLQQRFARMAQSASLPPELPGDWDLPENYGLNRLFLTARQPDLLFLYWELAPDQRDQLIAPGTQLMLILRLIHLSADGKEEIYRQFPLDPEGREYYLRIDLPGERFRAELGLAGPEGFQLLASSGETVLPRSIPRQGPIRFVTIPLDYSMTELEDMMSTEPGAPSPKPLAERLAEEQEARHTMPFPAPRPSEFWQPPEPGKAAEIQREMQKPLEQPPAPWSSSAGRKPE